MTLKSIVWPENLDKDGDYEKLKQKWKPFILPMKRH